MLYTSLRPGKRECCSFAYSGRTIVIMKWKNIFTVLLPCWHFWVSDPNNTFYKLLASRGRSVVEWSVGRLAPCGVVVRAVLKHNTIQYINRKPNKTNNSLNNNNNNHNTTSERTNEQTNEQYFANCSNIHISNMNQTTNFIRHTIHPYVYVPTM